MSPGSMDLVEFLGKNLKYPFHQHRKGCVFPGFDNHMKMVSHNDKIIQLEIKFLFGSHQDGNEKFLHFHLFE